MRKVCAFAALLLLLGVLALGQQPRAQLTMTGVGGGFGGASSGCSQATSFIARTDGTGPNSAYTTFICGGVTDGWWSKMDAVYLWASNNQSNALLNLVSSSGTASQFGSTFTANAGFNVPSGQNAEVAMLNSSTFGGNYVQNAAHVSSCVIETGGTGSFYGNAIILATNSAGTTTGQNIFAKNGGNTYMRINDNPESSPIATNAGTTTGHWLGNRSGATAVQGYKNGSSIGSDTETSQAPNNFSWTIGVPNVGAYDGLELAATIGGSLTSGDVSNLYSRLSTYLTAVHGSSC